MLDIIFYFQILFIIGLAGYAFYSKNGILFAATGVFVSLTGLMLASGEPIDYATGAFTVVQGFGGDVNVTKIVADFNSYTASTSSPIWMWSQMMVYGGVVFVIIGLFLAISSIMNRNVEEGVV